MQIYKWYRGKKFANDTPVCGKNKQRAAKVGFSVTTVIL